MSSFYDSLFYSLIESIKNNNISSFRKLIKTEQISSYFHKSFLKKIIIYDRYNMLKEYHRIYPKEINDLTDTAIMYKREKCLQLLLTLGDILYYGSSNKAAKTGHLNILKYVINIEKQCDNETLYYAARSGNIDCVKYIRESIYFENDNIFSDIILSSAAKSGSLEVYNYLYPFYSSFEASRNNEDIILAVIEGGNIDILKKYDIKNFISLCPSSLKIAAKYGNISMLQFLLENKYHNFDFISIVETLFKDFDGVITKQPTRYNSNYIDVEDCIYLSNCRNKFKNVIECFYLLVEEHMKSYTTINLEKLQLNDEMITYIDLNNPIIRKYLFGENIKIASPLKEAIEAKKKEIELRLKYFIMKDRVTLDVVKYIVKQYL